MLAVVKDEQDQDLAVDSRRAGADASISDADLVVAAADGDRWARDALYRRYARSLGGAATRLLGTRQDVDDIVHDTFLRAFQKLSTLREPQRFRPWLFAIATTQVRMLLRRRRLRSFVGLHIVEDASLERLAAKDLDAEARLELKELDRALKTLSADQRIAWMLRHVEGHTLEETAIECGCSLATIKRRLRSASQEIDRARVTSEST